MWGRADRRGVGRELLGPVQTRRNCLKCGAFALLTGLTRSLLAQEARTTLLTADEERIVTSIREKAKKAGLGAFGVGWTEHFLGIGNVPPDYRSEALRLCDSFAREFIAHFREVGFKLELPARRMVVVLLKDAADFRAYIGDTREATGGQYDLDTNQLVVFDARSLQAELKAQGSDPERVNTFKLVHETAHMLSYNTGLFPTGRDIPVAISEGLATYSEFWSPQRGRAAFGRFNDPRLRSLEDDEQGIGWIPVAKLLSDDDIFNDDKAAAMAYAESWLLVRYLLRQPGKLPKLKAYLAGLPKQDSGASRESYATSALGPLKQLDQDIRGYGRQVRKRRK